MRQFITAMLVVATIPATIRDACAGDTDTTFSKQASQNLEGTVGYRIPLAGVFSVTDSAGIGEHWRQNSGTAP